MTGQILNRGTSAALALILPLALAIFLVVTAWPFLVLLVIIGIIWNVWQTYQWQKWSRQVHPFFKELVKENQGCLTPMDLSLKANLTGRAATRFLEKKAEEYGAVRKVFEDKGTVYYFLTVSALDSIFADEEMEADEEATSIYDKLSLTSATTESINFSATTITKESNQSIDQPSESIALETNNEPPQSPTSKKAEDNLPVSDSSQPLTIDSNQLDQKGQPSSSFKDQLLALKNLIQPNTEAKSEKPSAIVDTDSPHQEAQNNLASETLKSEDSTSLNADADDFVEEDEDTEIESSSDESPTLSKGLTQAQLAKRLDLHSSTIGKRKSDADFAIWSQTKDPDGIGWEYSLRRKKFLPVDS